MTTTAHQVPFGFWAGGMIHDIRDQPYRVKDTDQMASFTVATLNVPEQAYIRLALPSPDTLSRVPRDQMMMFNISGWPNKDGAIRWRYRGDYQPFPAPEVPDPETGVLKPFTGLAIIGTFVTYKSRQVRDYDNAQPNAKKIEHRFKLNMAARENPDYPEVLLERSPDLTAFAKDAVVLAPIQDPYASKRGVIYRITPGQLPIKLDF